MKLKKKVFSNIKKIFQCIKKKMWSVEGGQDWSTISSIHPFSTLASSSAQAPRDLQELKARYTLDISHRFNTSTNKHSHKQTQGKVKGWNPLPSCCAATAPTTVTRQLSLSTISNHRCNRCLNNCKEPRHKTLLKKFWICLEFTGRHSSICCTKLFLKSAIPFLDCWRTEGGGVATFMASP